MLTEGIALPTQEKKQSEANDNWVCPEFKVSGIFSSHMVLQRDMPIRIWGFSTGVGAVVTGCLGGETVSAEVPSEKRWVLEFTKRPASKDPITLEIRDSLGHSAYFDDILIGDVWFLGGQSNMELNLSPIMSYYPDLEFDENDNFRLFTQTQAYPYEHQPEFCGAPQRDIINPDWCWRKPGREAAYGFSALGYFFAKELTKTVDVPMGMLMACAGGACVRELVPEWLAHEMGYTYGANVRESGYYNALIAPLIGLSFRAQIYFQGESETFERGMAERYAKEFSWLVLDERKTFGFDFPFYNVQLSSYCEEGSKAFLLSHVIRNQQVLARKMLDKYYLAVDMDLGSPETWPDWAHSPRKQELASRLVKLVLCSEYGILTPEYSSSPMPVSAVMSEDGRSVDVQFEFVAGGLKSASGSLSVSGFCVGDLDGKTPVPAVISSRDTVTLDVSAFNASDVRRICYDFDSLILPEAVDLLNGIDYPAGTFVLSVSRRE